METKAAKADRQAERTKIMVTATSNLKTERLNNLDEPARSKAIAMIAKANSQGIAVLVVCTDRSIAEQTALYALGRTRPGKIVTNAKGGDSVHNYRLAWDLCPVVDGKLAWARHDLFDKLGAIAVELGIIWGGNFKKLKDKPHFQYTGGLTLAGLKCGLRPPIAKQTTKTYKIVIDANGAPFSESEQVKITQNGGFAVYMSADRKTLSTQGSVDNLTKVQKAAVARGYNACIKRIKA